MLIEGWSARKIIELGSPVTPDALAGVIGDVLGRPVHAQTVPRDRWAATFESFGMAPGTTGAYEEMLDGFNSGWIHFGVPGTESVAGRTTAAQVFAQARSLTVSDEQVTGGLRPSLPSPQFRPTEKH